MDSEAYQQPPLVSSPGEGHREGTESGGKAWVPGAGIPQHHGPLPVRWTLLVRADCGSTLALQELADQHLNCFTLQQQQEDSGNKWTS